MAVERTLALVKPDAVARGVVGEALRAAEAAGLAIVALKRVWLTRAQAEDFYAVHREREFFGPLTAFISEGPIVAAVLEGEDAVGVWRRLLGATDPAAAAPKSLRRRLGTSIERNACHGSDGVESAAREIAQLFAAIEIHGAAR